MKVYEQLKRKRKQAGLSQAEVAQATSLSQQYVSRIESGKEITVGTMEKYANALGYTLEIKEMQSNQTEDSMTINWETKINLKKRSQVRKCVDAAKNFDRVHRMIIFGSAVTDQCRDDSDVDICLDINGSTRGKDMYELAVALSEACDHNCDILSYQKLNGKIKDEVDTKGVVVYEF